jgi:hypothetical protein
MDQHGRTIALRPSQPAMLDGGGGRAGIAVFIRQLGSAQTYYKIVNQLGKMFSALLIAGMKVVEFGRLLRSCQPVCD